MTAHFFGRTLRCVEQPSKVQPVDVLIVAAGEANPRPLLKQLAAQSDLTIVADGGAASARLARLRVDHFVGDGDSLRKRERCWLEEAPFPVHWHPVEKDETDLELALELALEQGARTIHILGGWGGRSDHALGNVFVLERSTLQGVQTFLWAGYERLCTLVPGRHALGQAFVGQRLSLLPLSREVEGLSTQGLRYNLRAETLHRAASRGVSNEVIRLPVRVEFERGTLLQVQAYGRATLDKGVRIRS